MKPFPFLVLCVLTFFVVNTTVAQQPDTAGLKSILAKTDAVSQAYPQEKVHIHFDKPYYATGDTAWFKIYVTSGLHLPSALSKIVYIDISRRDTLIKSLKFPVTNGLAWGSLALDKEIYKQGNYHFRAYTRWMINFDQAYFFSRNITIGSNESTVNTSLSFAGSGASTTAKIAFKDPNGVPQANKKVSWEIDGNGKQQKGKGVTDMSGMISVPIGDDRSPDLAKQQLTTVIELNKTQLTHSFALKRAIKNLDLQFFPEGGELVSGLAAKVAFKAIKADGLGVDVKGTITDNEGHVVTDFSSQHLGMGVVVISPEANKTYTANVTAPAIYKGTYQLPKVKPVGITMVVNNNMTAPAVGVRVICNPEFLSQNQGKMFYMVAKVGETVCYAAQTSLTGQLFSISIPKDKFPSGIVQITLFNEKSEPLTERLTFVRRTDDLGLTVKSEKPVYPRRGKVKLTLGAKNGTLATDASLSVSVVDETKVPIDENAEVSILSNLLLTSDLKGFVEKPSYYFNKPSEKTASDLDILMLTQGYRRFLYTDMLSNRLPKIFFMPEQGIEISGVLRTATGTPVNKGNVRLRIPDRYYSAYTQTNTVGVFRFPNLMLSDSSEVIVSSSDYRYKNPMLTVDPIAMQPVLAPVTRPDEVMNIDSSMNAYLQNSRRVFKSSMMLKEVSVVAKAPSKAPSHSDYPALSGLNAWADHTVPKERFEGCNDLLICIQNTLTGVTFRDNNFYVTRDLNAGRRVPMQVFYNGMPVDVNFLAGVLPTEIDNIEIFLRDDLGMVNQTYQSNGALVINGKKKEKGRKMTAEEIRNLLPKPGELKIRPQGYSVSREFYSPQYAVAASTIMGNDLRTTIYWNPKVKTDKTTGLSSVEFYNADGRGSYRVTVEGIDSEGHIGRTVYRYRVE